MLNVTDNYPVK